MLSDCIRDQMTAVPSASFPAAVASGVFGGKA